MVGDIAVVAIVFFGDPTHVGNSSYNEGTGTNDGVGSLTENLEAN